MENRCEVTAPHEGIIQRLQKEMPDAACFIKSAALFKALCDPTRSKIIWALDQTELCVCDLSELLGMTQSAISHQLSGLRKANMVKSRKSGKEVFYSLADEHVSMMLESGMEHGKE
ncbi:MAG: metalloregulator ArsR/SmtB family transcription factor [Eubacteriales bacterium]|nr:metalloregulator ArsR/SmtB family transcription factor [Eubacteriales bacterium]